MSERTAKRLRREKPEQHEPELNLSFGSNRKRQRARYVDRSFTATGTQVRMVDNSGHVHYKKAAHVVNDYTQQREPLHPTEYTNYVRHQITKANRAKKAGKI